MKMFRILIISVGCFAIVGCSTFTTELKSSTISKPAVKGLIYKLPAKQFSVTTTYQITGCNVINNETRFEANIQAALSERLIGDDAYVLDYEKLDAWTKITNTEFRLSEAGILTGINSSISDQTGAVIQNSVSAVTGIARAVALSPAQLVTQQLKVDSAEKANEKLQSISSLIANIPGVNQKDLPDITDENFAETVRKLFQLIPKPCAKVEELITTHTNAKANLNIERGKDKARDSETRKKVEAEAEIIRLSSLGEIYDALGMDAAKKGLMDRIQKQEKLLAEAVSELKKLGTSGTEKATAALVNATAALTVSTTRDILPRQDGDEFQVEITNSDVPKSLSESVPFNILAMALPKVTLKVTALVGITQSAQPEDDISGIVYRMPVASIARVKCECTDGIRLLIEKPTQVPQFGSVGKLSLKNEIFANNSLEVAFNAMTGGPERLAFQSQSKAEAASAAMRDAANSYLQLQKDKRDDILAANKSSIEQQNALLALERSRAEASLAGQQADASASLLPIQTQQSLVSAQIELLREQQRLDAVRSGSASTSETQLEALINQQKLLEQQLKILQLEKQIAEEKALSNIDP